MSMHRSLVFDLMILNDQLIPLMIWNKQSRSWAYIMLLLVSHWMPFLVAGIGGKADMG